MLPTRSYLGSFLNVLLRSDEGQHLLFKVIPVTDVEVLRILKSLKEENGVHWVMAQLLKMLDYPALPEQEFLALCHVLTSTSIASPTSQLNLCAAPKSD